MNCDEWRIHVKMTSLAETGGDDTNRKRVPTETKAAYLPTYLGSKSNYCRYLGR